MANSGHGQIDKLMARGNKILFNTTNYLEDENFEQLRKFDVVIVGDLLYDDDISNSLKATLDKLLDGDKAVTVLVGDPGRPYLENISSRLRVLAEYELEESFRCTNGLSSVKVYEYS